jgi:hypothetical protein
MLHPPCHQTIGNLSAFSADRANVKGDVFLSNGFSAEGTVRLPGARIEGDLDCTRGKFGEMNVETAAIVGRLILERHGSDGGDVAQPYKRFGWLTCRRPGELACQGESPSRRLRLRAHFGE